MLVFLAAAGLFTVAIQRDLPGTEPPQGNRVRVEAVMDRGLTADIVLRCGKGVAIVTMSRTEHRFCAPSGQCFDALVPAVRDACR